MTLSIFTEIIGIIFGGSVGAFLMQLYTAKESKDKMRIEVEGATVDVEQKKLTVKQDAFDTVYAQLTKCLNDYNMISDEYHAYRERSRKFEEEVQDKIRKKCDELAELKAKVTFFKGIRCYNTDCPHRLRVNPDKTKADQSIKQK